MRDGQQISDNFIDQVGARLEQNQPVRRGLPGWGRINVERQLPFLCVYRRPHDREDEGTSRLISSGASYILAPGDSGYHLGLKRLVHQVARIMGEKFGSFLLLELWSDESPVEQATQDGLDLRFSLYCPGDSIAVPLGDRFDEYLSRIRLADFVPNVNVFVGRRCWAQGHAALISATEAQRLRCGRMGLAVAPVYRDPKTGESYPILLRKLVRQFSRALHRTFYYFTKEYTSQRPENFHELGRRAVVKAVWEVDRRLGEVSDSFDFLLQVTPFNADEAWKEFRKSGYQKNPAFRYRPLPIDPVLLKRRLYETPVEKVEDPALMQLFRTKQDELDRQITLLDDRGSRRFVHGSIQLFGGVEDSIVKVAKEILDRIPSRTRDESKGGYVDAASFARLAENEIHYYRKRFQDFQARVEIRDDIISGLMVSQGNLLVSRRTRIAVSRVEALLQHEIGTHSLTYFNGAQQPFRLLRTGLPGYDALQEGLAVLGEYLIGGMSRPRLRLLAARVMAARHMLDGASFVDTFGLLDRNYDFERKSAFTITMRIYRGGGLTKDAVYLKGLVQILEYLGRGGKITPLYVGKVAASHVPIIRELQWREILKEPPILPRYLDHPDARRRLERIRSGMTVLDLVKDRKK